MPDRKNIPSFSPFLKRNRHLVINAFCRIKDIRRVATRYDSS